MKLEEIAVRAPIQGIEPDQIVTVESVTLMGPDSVNVVDRTINNALRERMFFRNDEHRLSIPESGCPWGFDASLEEFNLATEATRINLAYLFDSMMAVHTSNIESLPHQILVVYETILSRQPLRFVLLDDPEAAKSIMSELLIYELRHIEVKGRTKGKKMITVTKNEIITALNQSEKFLLAIVLVDRDRCEGPYYVKKPFYQEPDWAVTSINLDLNELLKKAESARVDS